MIPDCEGWWWRKSNGSNIWHPVYIRVPAEDCDRNDTWGERLYAPNEYPRYLRLTGEPVAVTHTSMNGRINVDFDKDGCVVGIEILHAEGTK